jgi:hypothetical protein
MADIDFLWDMIKYTLFSVLVFMILAEVFDNDKY